MKRLILISAVMAVCLLSCKSKQAIVTESSGTVSVIDTTKVNIDTAHCLRTEIDTTTTAGQFEGGGMVEFVEGGGEVSIDTAGNVTLKGVKNIKGKHSGSVTQNKGVTKVDERASEHAEQQNGIAADEQQQQKTEERQTQGQRWYEKILTAVGALCCIALLMWLLFLYLKQKK